MEALVVGEPPAAAELAERLAGEGIAAVATRLEAPAEDGIGALAGALVRLEREIDELGPSMVVLADRGDRALAAALVATKLTVPVVALESGGGDRGGRIVELIVDEVVSDEPAAIAAGLRLAAGASRGQERRA